jgi:hypothetical protein
MPTQISAKGATTEEIKNERNHGSQLTMRAVTMPYIP